MTIPQHTFEFEGSEYLRYPEDPWNNPKMVPNEWFAKNIYKYLYSPEYIIQESEPYNINEGPWSSGIYFLIIDDTIIYVGKSVEIMRRLNEHREKSWGFNKYWCFGGMPSLYIEHIEAFYIHFIEPPFNEKYPHLHEVTEPLVRKARLSELEYINDKLRGQNS